MRDADIRLAQIYLGAFTNPANWSVEDHAAGLRAVFVAGSDASRKSLPVVSTSKEQDDVSETI